MADVLIGKGGQGPVSLRLPYGNRHGLIAGATGTGKTVTLQVMAEGFAAQGVPVFVSDIKGDLSGIAMPGADNPKFVQRAKELGIADYRAAQFPTVFWDVFGEQGHPVRATVSEMGPLLLARMLELNDVQEGVLNIVFKVADEQGLLLLDFKDLQAMLQFVADNAAELTTAYGNVSKATIGTVQRKLLVLEQQGGASFFGEPALEMADLINVTPQGLGQINVLVADKLVQSPRLYATFLLWLLSELFETLPEVGDRDRPRLVFFFDEAHLLFNDAPKPLLEKVEQVVRLIRSKGVGVYFVTQNPLDVPETVLGQLGNRVQHALRAFTPKDQKAVRSAADTFRANKAFKTAEVITELAVGEALVSVLEDKGVPSVVDRVLVRPPVTRVGPVKPDERQKLVAASPYAGNYEQAVDRESAFEVLSGQAQKAQAQAQGGGIGGVLGSIFGGGGGGGGSDLPPVPRRGQTIGSGGGAAGGGLGGMLGGGGASGGGGTGGGLGGMLGGGGRAPRGRQAPSMGEQIVGTLAKAAVREIGGRVGRELVRGVLGGLFKGR